MKDMGDVVIISREEYRRLLAKSYKLNCLEMAGVDNWEHYSYAMELMKDEEEDEEDE